MLHMAFMDRQVSKIGCVNYARFPKSGHKLTIIILVHKFDISFPFSYPIATLLTFYEYHWFRSFTA